MNSAIIVHQRNNGQNIHFAMYLGFGYLSGAVRSKRHILQFTEEFHCFTSKTAENHNLLANVHDHFHGNKFTPHFRLHSSLPFT